MAEDAGNPGEPVSGEERLGDGGSGPGSRRASASLSARPTPAHSDHGGSSTRSSAAAAPARDPVPVKSTAGSHVNGSAVSVGRVSTKSKTTCSRKSSLASTVTSSSGSSSLSTGGSSSRRPSNGTTSSSVSGSSSGTWTLSGSGTRATTSSSGGASAGMSAGTSAGTSRATYADSSEASRRSICTIAEEGEDPCREAEVKARAGEVDGGLHGGDLQQKQDGQDLFQEQADEGKDEERKSSSVPSLPGWPPGEEWTEKKWLEMADQYDVQRRPTTMAGWEARKLKYPELFRSDVSICPSYSQYQVPYWSVCLMRSRRSMRRINRRLAEDIEELALLQTRALDGVRVVRSFSLGARPQRLPPDPLSAKERRRVEQLLDGHVHA